MVKIILMVMFLAGCSQDIPKQARKSPADRQAKAEARLSKTPVPRTYIIQGNQLHVLDIPVLDNSGFVEMQRCMVWRDAEFKTASISCPQQAEVLLSN